MKIEIDKPVVPKWFDGWYRVMKDAEHTDAFILRAILSANHYGRYCDYSRDDGFFDTDQFTYISENFMNVINAIQFGYEVEQEPVYYAKVKGWEILNGGVKWVYLENTKGFIIGDVIFSDNETEAMTKERWNKLGINDTNADFERVE